LAGCGKYDKTAVLKYAPARLRIAVNWLGTTTRSRVLDQVVRERVELTKLNRSGSWRSRSEDLKAMPQALVVFQAFSVAPSPVSTVSSPTSHRDQKMTGIVKIVNEIRR